ncbi:MAG: PQQ-binding-like beta-propeller repeat protein [Armatimonas sp.]
MSTEKKTTRREALGIFMLGAVGVTVVGCGGGGSSDSEGRKASVRLRVSWPAVEPASRYIPTYAKSLYFELYPKTYPQKRTTLVVNRPATLPAEQDVSFDGLYVEGDYVLGGAARVQPDGIGASVATGAAEIVVRAGMAPVALTLGSTLKRLEILGQPLAATVGVKQTLLSGAFDPDGRSLLLPGEALTWSVVSGGAFGTITAAGELTPTAAGTVRIRVAETGAGVSAEADVTVTSQTIIAALGTTPYPKETVDLFNTGLVTGHGATGVVAWTYDLGASSAFYTSTPILGGNGLVYGASLVTANTGGVGVHTSDGTKAFQVALNAGTPFSPVVLSTNLVCFPMNNTGLVALDANTGIERWRNSTVRADAPATMDRSGHILLAANDGVHVLDANNGQDITSYPGTNCSMPAVAQDGTVFYVRQVGASTAQGELVAINPTTRSVIWTATEIEQGHSPVIGPNGAVYVVGSQSGTAFTRLVAFNATTGAVLAEARNLFFGFSQDPVFGSDGLLYIGQGDKITAYDAGLNQIRQSPGINNNGIFYNTRRITIGSDGTLYVYADQNSPEADAKLLAYKTSDLSQKWELDQTGRVLGSIAVDSDGTLFFITDLGKLIAVR